MALEFDAISYFSSVSGLLAGELVFSAVPRPVSRAVLVLFLSGLAYSLAALLATAETTPWVCRKRSVPSCVNGHAISSSPDSNCPSTTACIVGSCCCCCFSHSAYWLPTRKKLLYTVANPARGLLNREKRTKEKVWQHTCPPPPPPHTARSEKNK